MHDIMIRGGLVYDGLNPVPQQLDIAIKDGLIQAMAANLTADAKVVISADGAIVAPAWVDIHTHYDGQVTWDSEMNPSASHGVGTIVMGNCGVGFAPVPKGGEQDLIDLMEGVEDIPGSALHEGMPWGAWETYGEYLDLLETKTYALDISSLIAHGAVRNFVMGARGRANEAATQDDLNAMSDIVEQALRDGAVGFSTSRILGHRSITGDPVPGTFANETEVLAIASAMKRAGSGVFQLIPSSTLGGGREGFEEHTALIDEIDLIAKLSRESGRAATFTLFQVDDWHDQWQLALEQVKAHNAAGAQIFPQVGSRPTGLVFSLSTYHPWMLKPTYLKFKDLPPAALREKLKTPEIRAALLTEPNDTRGVAPGSMTFGIAHAELNHAQIFELTGSSSYEPTAEEAFAHRAAAQGQMPAAYLLDYLLATPDAMAIMFFTNYAEYNLDAVRAMQMDEVTVTGLSDAGAHVCLIFDAVNPTYQLTYWGRDRSRGEVLDLGYLIHRATYRNAQLFGFTDRGHLAPGKRADINVIDFEGLQLGPLEVRQDLPAGGKRLMQGATGYWATIVNGVITRRFDEDTGARPGRLIRGGHVSAH